MASDKQIAANRLNAQRSTGPRTTQGKARSRRNGVKHGLTGDGVALSDEMRGEVDAALYTYNKHYRPQDGVEEKLVEMIALASVRVIRAHVAHEEALRAQRRRCLRDHDEARDAEISHAAGLLPSDPIAALTILERTAEGCDELCDRWDLLKQSLTARGFWSSKEEESAVRLLGERQYPTVTSAFLPSQLVMCSLACRAKRMPGSTALFFGRDDMDHALPKPPVAVAELHRIIDAEMARLTERADLLWEQYDGPDRAAAPILTLAPHDPVAERFGKYVVASSHLFNRAKGALESSRRADERDRDLPRPTSPAPKPEQAAFPMVQRMADIGLASGAGAVQTEPNSRTAGGTEPASGPAPRGEIDANEEPQPPG